MHYVVSLQPVTTQMMSPRSSSTPLTGAAEWVQLLFCVLGLKKKKPADSPAPNSTWFHFLDQWSVWPSSSVKALMWALVQGCPTVISAHAWGSMLFTLSALSAHVPENLSADFARRGGKKITQNPVLKKTEYELPACAYKSHCHYYKTAVPQIRQSVTAPYKTCPWCWSQMHSPRDIKQAFAACWCSLTWHITSGDSVLLRCWAVSYNLNSSSSSWIVFVEKLAHC